MLITYKAYLTTFFISRSKNAENIICFQLRYRVTLVVTFICPKQKHIFW